MNFYGEVHRRFLQSFVYNPAQTETEALEVYHLVCQEQGHPVGCLNQLVEEINLVITRCTTLEIKTVFCELTCRKYFVATNTAELKWTKSVSMYNKKEQEIFSKIVDELVRSARGCISSIAFLNLPAKGITKSERVEILSKFVRERWFSIKEGNYYMGVRGVVELEPYIMQCYRDMLSFCSLCNRLIFSGHYCGGCPEMSHLYCLQKYFGLTGHPPKCPHCDTEWPNWENKNQSDLDDDCDSM